MKTEFLSVSDGVSERGIQRFEVRFLTSTRGIIFLTYGCDKAKRNTYLYFGLSFQNIIRFFKEAVCEFFASEAPD